MQLNLGTSMRPEMALTISPRMIQSMEILQLGVMALQERLDQEIQENPFLERIGDGDEQDGYPNNPELGEIIEPPAEPETPKVETPEPELVIDPAHAEKDFERMEVLNEEWADHFDEESRPSANRMAEDMDKKHDAMANMAARPKALQEHLTDQLAYVDTEIVDVELVRFLISHLDERGYLTTPLEDIRQAYGKDITLQQVQEALEDLQSLEPAGIGAREYKECLLLQVRLNTPHRDLVRQLINNHLEDIQHNRFPAILKKSGCDLKTLQEAITVLKSLDPKPGAQFSSENVQYVVPDIVIEKNDKGEYDIRLLDDWTPKVYISRRYFELLRDKNLDAKTRELLQRKIQSAKWLIDAIEQRRATLMKVATAIIKHQRAFLDKGPEFIEPLKMQQIADVVGVHVTTVSRAVDDKWVQTPRGVFPLKRFFGGGTQSASGEEVAWEIIKRKLLDIIANENKSNPLSDEDLVTKLAEAGYPGVARRTVTKYRKALDIPSSRQRKVWTE
ncbi:MAG: RNA polymerase factor sigma-54 [Planctomycetes bacterium]|nr:RNA polymerase factor sigma-54 [Planctomycetota bacterium]